MPCAIVQDAPSRESVASLKIHLLDLPIPHIKKLKVVDATCLYSLLNQYIRIATRSKEPPFLWNDRAQAQWTLNHPNSYLQWARILDTTFT
jgi:hypothetical protein